MQVGLHVCVAHTCWLVSLTGCMCRASTVVCDDHMPCCADGYLCIQPHNHTTTHAAAQDDRALEIEALRSELDQVKQAFTDLR